MSEQEIESSEPPIGKVVPSSLPRITIRQRIFKQYKELVAAVQFLSAIPMPGTAQLFRTETDGPELVIGSHYFPVVGLLIALLLSMLTILIGPYLPSLVLAAVLVVSGIVLTGGLHLEGLMDACDGLFSRTSRERTLEIMRDSRVGSFGVLGGISIILLKFALLASFPCQQLCIIFLLVMPVARWAMLLTIIIFPSVRSGGLGSAVRQSITPRRIVVATIFALLIAISVGHLAGLYVIGVSVLVALLLGWWVTIRLGGLTGDIYGMIDEVTEVACLLFIIAMRFLLGKGSLG